MKQILIGFGFLILVGVASVARANGFLPNFEDVPMQDGLEAADHEGFLFSVPEGRIVETFVVSNSVSRRQFQRFYRDALRGLGWKEVKDESKLQEFSRGKDVLRIEILSADPLEARFALTPGE
ncbi:MAG: hypothetical protein LBB23_01870 [Rickettsiales bacterium]|jgi:hypothetical protein|nr:hypothetical protein [Rickettsiales bacterium]